MSLETLVVLQGGTVALLGLVWHDVREWRKLAISQGERLARIEAKLPPS